MTGIGSFALIGSLLQITVPSYGLRLVRRFGTGRVGWFLVASFSSLAALHLLKPFKIANGAAHGLTVDVAFALASALLLVGMAHLESLFSDRRAAAHARRRELELEESRRTEAVRELAGCVASQFSNILTLINGHVAVLMDKSQDPGTTQQLRQISTAASHAARLTRELLLVSGRYLLERRVLDVNELIQKLAPTLRVASGGHVLIEKPLGSTLPLIFADVRLVEHIVAILVLHAGRALPKGGVITVSSMVSRVDAAHARHQHKARAGEFVCLIIHDCRLRLLSRSGSGLPFVRSRKNRESEKCSNVHLAGVHAAAEQLGGWIETNNEPALGSEFRVYLPRLHAAAAVGQQSGGQVCG